MAKASAPKPSITVPTWLTGKADAASLPALLESMAPKIDVTTIDELYLFPTRRVQGVESTVFVFSVHDEGDLRRVLTAHLRATRNKRGEPAIETKLDDHATTPAERVPRVIEGVLRRLSEEFAATPPSHCRIDRSEQRWRELIDLLTSAPKGQALPEELLADEKPETPAEPATPEEEASPEEQVELADEAGLAAEAGLDEEAGIDEEDEAPPTNPSSNTP